MTDQLTTLHALNVKDGDVVEFVEANTIQQKIGHPFKVSDLRSDEPKWRIVSRASDTPTIWADMTPEEKGALLLADHERKPIEVFHSGKWCPRIHGGFGGQIVYRIKPEPKRETVKRSLHGAKFMGYVAIDMIDDVPQWDTMRPWNDSMERLT